MCARCALLPCASRSLVKWNAGAGLWRHNLRRSGGYGSFLLAIYDREEEEYQTISKIGTGFSEELLKEVSTAMQAHLIDVPPRYYRRAPRLGCTRCCADLVAVSNGSQPEGRAFTVDLLVLVAYMRSWEFAIMN